MELPNTHKDVGQSAISTNADVEDMHRPLTAEGPLRTEDAEPASQDALTVKFVPQQHSAGGKTDAAASWDTTVFQDV